MCCMRLAGNTGCKKWRKKSPSEHHYTTSSSYIFVTMACINNRKKLVKQQYLLHMWSQYGEFRPISGWDLLASLGHPNKFQWLSSLGSITARHSSSGRQPNFAALNRGYHLYSAGRPSRWALAHIVVFNNGRQYGKETWDCRNVNWAAFSSLHSLTVNCKHHKNSNNINITHT